MISVEKMILHDLEPSRNTLVCSDVCLDGQAEWLTVVTNKIARAFTSTQKKCGMFQREGRIRQIVEAYQSQHISFMEMSKQMAAYIFEMKRHYAQYDRSALLVAEVLYEDSRYIIGLDNAYQDALMREVLHEEGRIKGNLTVCPFILSPTLLKKDSAFMIGFQDNRVSSVENKVEIEGKKCWLYHDLILSCTAATSYQEAVKTMSKICEEVSKGYDLELLKVLPKMKQVINEHVEAQEAMHMEDVAQAVFHDQPLAKRQFVQQMKEQGIQEAIPVEHHKSSKAEKVQKLRTDKGFELTIPLDYMDSTDYIEFHTEENGSISIRLKNISRIISK